MKVVLALYTVFHYSDTMLKITVDFYDISVKDLWPKKIIHSVKCLVWGRDALARNATLSNKSCLPCQ